MLLRLITYSGRRGATFAYRWLPYDGCQNHRVLSSFVKTREQQAKNGSLLHDNICISNAAHGSVGFASIDVFRNAGTLRYNGINSLNANNTSSHAHALLYNSQVSFPSLLSLRSFSTSPYRRKDESIAEQTVRQLKEKAKEEAAVPAVSESSPPAPPKKSLGQKIMGVLRHYAHGFRLLYIDFKIAARLVWRVLHGETLSRREKQQLVRTTADMFRLVPFLVIIIIPFAELLLPVLLIVFPNMLPSTFKEEDKEQDKLRKRLKVKLEMAKFLQDTVEDMALQRKGSSEANKYQDFVSFMQKVRSSGVTVSTEEIMKFSQLFEDEITLDAMGPEQLKAINRLLELPTMGPTSFLRFRLDMALKTLEADDKLIQEEGIDTLVAWELQDACRARGMRSLGVPEDRLRMQLAQWLDLHLNHKIPTSLLLLSRALYLPEQLAPPELLKATISALPEDAADEAKVKVSELAAERVDNRVKLEYIKREDAAIRKEKEEEAKLQAQEAARRQAEELKAQEDLATGAQRLVGTPSLVDSAPVDTVKVSPQEVLVDKAAVIKEKEDEISLKDLQVIEDVLTKVVDTKAKMEIEKQELAELKEDVNDYKENLQDLKSIVVSSGGKEGDIQESKAAQRLGKKVNKMIAQMDGVMDSLIKQKMSLQESLEMKEVKVKRSAELQENVGARQAVMNEIDATKTNLVGINELVLALRRLQKVPDDTKFQRIMQVLDEDKDGIIDVKDALRVIELLGSENVKMGTSQVADVIRLLQAQLHAEEEVEELEKAKAAATADAKVSATSEVKKASNEKVVERRDR